MLTILGFGQLIKRHIVCLGRERGIKEGVQITIIKSADRGKKKKEIERERVVQDRKGCKRESSAG